jgi:SNF2 family DNA or RNA helicase
MTNVPSKKPSFQHKLKPFDHQQDVLLDSFSREYYALFWEMGTGKTKTLLDTVACLWYAGKINGVIIVADKGNYLNWIFEEIPKHLPDEIQTRIAYWTAAPRKKERIRIERIQKLQEGKLDFICVNVEALSGKKAFEVCREFLLHHKTIMIVDESTSIKSSKAKRTINCQRLGRAAEYRRIATGTPVTQDPLDLYAQSQFLEPGLLGHRSYVAFRAEYSLLENVILGSRRFLKVVGHRNLDQLAQKVKPWASRILKKDCLDLPEKLYEKHYVDMTEEQWQIYNSIKDESIAELEQGLLTCTSALTAVMKMQQVVCGHLKLDDDTVVEVANNRIDELISLLRLINDDVIIWCAFQKDIEMVIAAIEEDTELKAIGFPVAYYGKTSKEERLEALHQYASNPKCRWFVGTPATGGKGLTLISGATVIYYSNSYNLEHRLQSEDRAHRIGQKRNVTYIDLIAARTVDQRIQKALRNKQDLASQVIDRDQILELLKGQEE